MNQCQRWHDKNDHLQKANSPFFFFVYRRMRFLILGRSVGRIEKKKPKNKIQEVLE